MYLFSADERFTDRDFFADFAASDDGGDDDDVVWVSGRLSKRQLPVVSQQQQQQQQRLLALYADLWQRCSPPSSKVFTVHIFNLFLLIHFSCIFVVATMLLLQHTLHFSCISFT